MSRIPAGLLYLAIYNPTLRPTSLTSPDDEDAEEQAQILFYTARERAVSRDRMLRQVGLAKALVNFSDIFNSDKACDTVHSQTRRMITIEPEPGFWIHACVELAKTPRAVSSKRKGKDKAKGKPKDGLTASQEQVFECHDSSVHDVALRSHIMRGYEDFKLIHGSFSSVLSTLGQQALELQLERFFTVWAWKWDVEQHTNFSVDLGAPLHPLSPYLVPIVDDYGSTLPDTTLVFVLAPPHIIPSTAFSSRRFPSSIIHHVVLRIPPREEPRPPQSPELPDDKVLAKDLVPVSTSLTARGLDPTTVALLTHKSVESATANTLMAMANVTRAMDPRQLKWGWPGYLSFGKGAQAKLADDPQPSAVPQSAPPATTGEASPDDSEDKSHEAYLGVPDGPKSLEVDRESLQEALSDNQSIASGQRMSPSPSSTSARASVHLEGEGGVDEDGVKPAEGEGEDSKALDHLEEVPDASEAPASIHSVPSETEPTQPLPPALPTLRPSTVNLAEPTNPAATRKWRVWQMTHDEMTVALMTEFDSPEPSDAVPRAVTMLGSLREELARQQAKAASEKPMPSATNILQPQSAHVLAVNGYTVSSSHPLAKDPEHLYHAKQMFQSDHDVYEVFSRGQNPQHWYVAKRRVEITEQLDQGQVYMEIARKESTLTDADNEMAAVVREFADNSDGWGMLSKS